MLKIILKITLIMNDELSSRETVPNSKQEHESPLSNYEGAQ